MLVYSFQFAPYVLSTHCVSRAVREIGVKVWVSVCSLGMSQNFVLGRPLFLLSHGSCENQMRVLASLRKLLINRNFSIALQGTHGVHEQVHEIPRTPT